MSLVLDEIKDVGGNSEFEDIETAEEELTFGVLRKAQEVQPVCKEDGEAVPTSVLRVTKLPKDNIGTRNGNEKIFERTNTVQSKIEKARAADYTMRRN